MTRKILQQIDCEKCGKEITKIRETEDGQLDFDKTLPQPLVINTKPGEVRVFCPCGGITHPSLDSTKLRQSLTFEEAITTKARPGEWQFAKISVPYLDDLPAIDSESVNACTVAFLANIARVNQLANGTLLALGMTSAQNMAQLHMVLSVKNEAIAGKTLGDDTESQRYKNAMSALRFRDQIRTPSAATPELLQQIKYNGSVILDRWADIYEEITHSVSAVLTSQLTSAWTAFEIFSADLWVAIVNERPRPLALNFARSIQAKAPDKSISITALAEYGDRNFDLSRSMGTIFAQQKKVDFTSLSSTRFAYEKAFGESLPALEVAELRLLELIRNLVLHRAGTVDDEFLRRLKDSGLDTHPDCTEAAKDKLFPISADIVTRLSRAAVDAGIQLLRFIAIN